MLSVPYALDKRTGINFAFQGNLTYGLSMENKTPKAFFGYSIALIVIGAVALRYYYTSSTSSIGVLGTILLFLGVASLTATSIYTLHIKGERLLTRLLSASIATLFSGLGLLRLSYYINSHSISDKHWNGFLELIGTAIFLLGVGLLAFTIVLVIIRSIKHRG